MGKNGIFCLIVGENVKLMLKTGFIGNGTSSLDNKGRCSFPKELRQYLPTESDNRVIVTIGSEKSLMLYSLTEWETFLKDISHRPRTPDNIKFKRLVMNYAKESKLDAQNRITLSESLIRYAQIDKEITFAGEGNYVGLWNPERHATLYGLDNENNIDGIDDLFYWDKDDQEV